MRASGAAATCLPVRLDSHDWSAALFMEMAGSECKEDRRALRKSAGPLPVGMEFDLVETDHGSVVTLRAEIHTGVQRVAAARPATSDADPGGADNDAPFACEVLLLPGEGGLHFEALKLLCSQARFAWFYGDQQHWLVHSQSLPLGANEHAAFDRLLKDASRHDAVVRLTGRYDGKAALSEVVRHYELRAAAPEKAPPWAPPGNKPAH